MSVVLFIGGYARSGKSSLLNWLEDIGYVVCSTSRVLDNLADCSVTALGLTPPKDHEERRSLKINIAEGIIVPVLSRKAMVRACIDRIQASEDSDQTFVFETIGGDEYEMAQDMLNPRIPTMNINVRRDSERAGIDIRKLLPYAIELRNNYDSVSQWQVAGALHIQLLAAGLRSIHA